MVQCKYLLKSGIPMNQMPFTGIEYSNYKRKTKREDFRDTMDERIPWKESLS